MADEQTGISFTPRSGGLLSAVGLSVTFGPDVGEKRARELAHDLLSDLAPIARPEAHSAEDCSCGRRWNYFTLVPLVGDFFSVDQRRDWCAAGLATAARLTNDISGAGLVNWAEYPLLLGKRPSQSVLLQALIGRQKYSLAEIVDHFARRLAIRRPIIGRLLTFSPRRPLVDPETLGLTELGLDPLGWFLVRTVCEERQSVIEIKTNTDLGLAAAEAARQLVGRELLREHSPKPNGMLCFERAGRLRVPTFRNQMPW